MMKQITIVGRAFEDDGRTVTVPAVYLEALENSYRRILKKSGNSFPNVIEDECLLISFPTLEEIKEKLL